MKVKWSMTNLLIVLIQWRKLCVVSCVILLKKVKNRLFESKNILWRRWKIAIQQKDKNVFQFWKKLLESDEVNQVKVIVELL